MVMRPIPNIYVVSPEISDLFLYDFRVCIVIQHHFFLPLIQNILFIFCVVLSLSLNGCFHFRRDTDPFGVRRYWDIVTTLLVLYLCWRIPFDLGLDWWYPPKQLKAFELFADIWFGKTCLLLNHARLVVRHCPVCRLFRLVY